MGKKTAPVQGGKGDGTGEEAGVKGLLGHGVVGGVSRPGHDVHIHRAHQLRQAHVHIPAHITRTGPSFFLKVWILPGQSLLSWWAGASQGSYPAQHKGGRMKVIRKVLSSHLMGARAAACWRCLLWWVACTSGSMLCSRPPATTVRTICSARDRGSLTCFKGREFHHSF